MTHSGARLSERLRATRALPVLVGFVGVLGAVVAYLIESWPVRPQIDDAYIAYRYARNLVEGYGLVFNPGERVEGFTSPSWVLLVALGLKLGVAAPAMSRGMGFVCGSLLLVLSYVHAGIGLDPAKKWRAALAPWLLWSATSFSYWANSGLETPLLCVLFQLALVLLATGRTRAAALAAAFATVTRPEGIVMLAFVCAVHLHRRGFRALASWILPGAAALFVVAATAARYAYYRSFLPNTYYAKIGTIPFWLTALYSAGFVLAYVVPVALPALVAVRRVPVLRSGLLWVGITFAYVLYEGADVFSQFRFYLPALSPLLSIATRGIIEAWEDRTRGSVLVVACGFVAILWYHAGTIAGASALVVALASVWIVPRSFAPRTRLVVSMVAALVPTVPLYGWPQTVPFLWHSLWPQMIVNDVVFSRQRAFYDVRFSGTFIAQAAKQACWRIRRVRPRVRTVASTGLGNLSYCFRGRVIDLLGLTDAVIARSKIPSSIARRADMIPAHQRTNAEYVLGERPDFILMSHKDEAPLRLPALLELWEHPDFDRLYVWDPAVMAYGLRSRESAE